VHVLGSTSWLTVTSRVSQRTPGPGTQSPLTGTPISSSPSFMIVWYWCW
jgi:hypothetical protein